MPVSDYYGSEQTDLNVDEALEVDINGNPVSQGIGRDIPKSVVEQKGDLLVGLEDDIVDRFAVGADGQALVANSSTETGLAWETPASQEHEHEEYATDADLTAHAATSHGTAHPDLAAHDTLGLATQAELNTHAGHADPHPVYSLGDHDHDGEYSPDEHDHLHNHDVDIEEAVDAHEALANPHPGYATDGDLTTHAGTPHGGTTVVQQDAEPVGQATDGLWIDTNESAGVGLSSIIGYGEYAATLTPVTALTDIVTVTITVPAGRRIRVSGSGVFTSSVATDEGTLRVMEGATTPRGSSHITNSTWNGKRMDAVAILSPSAGSHTYKLSYGRVNGSGTHTMHASATAPAFLLVEDITGTLWPAGQSVDVGMLPLLPACRAYHNVNQSIPGSTVTALAFNTDQYDTTGAMHDTVTQNGRIYAPVAGIYTATATASWAFHATGLRTLTLLAGGTTNIIVNSVMENAVSTSFGNRMVATGQMKLNAGDYVHAEGYQTSGGALNVEGGEWQCTLSLTYMGRAV